MAKRSRVTRYGSFMGHRMTGRTEWLLAIQCDDGNEGLIYKFNDPQQRQQFIDFLDFEDIPYITTERIVPLIPVHDIDMDEFTVKVQKPRKRSTKTKTKRGKTGK